MSDAPAPSVDPEGTGPASRVALAPGLYLVATPIGSARDITLRGLDILLSADVIAAEDTRSARRLLQLHGIALGRRPLIAYHDHNADKTRPRILGLLEAGASVAYVSEAGTPLVADPGYRLARDAIDAERTVTTAPGPSAAIAALTVSGLPSDRFLFAGFAPVKPGERARWLSELAPVRSTVILYVTARRVHSLLGELCETWGAERDAALCREMTKRFEEVRRGTLSDILAGIEDVPLKGEIVLVVGPPEPTATPLADVDTALRAALRAHRVKDAAAQVAEAYGLPRRDVYQRALVLKSEDGG